MSEILRKMPGSVRSLATEAGLSRTALHRVAAGDLDLTPASARKVVRALRRWGETYVSLADKLERAVNEEEDR